MRHAPPRILASDIDGTLLRDGEPTPGLETLRLLLETARVPIHLVFATGRSYSQTRSLVARGVLPEPAAVAAMVGTQIWFPPWATPEAKHRAALSRRWNRDAVVQAVADLDGVTPQPAIYQTPVKASFYAEDPAIEQRVASLLRRRRLTAHIVWSAGRYLDLLPAGAGKRQAVEAIRRRLKVARHRVLYSGDSGNDLSVLQDPRYMGIAVGNAEAELDHLTPEDTVHQAALPYAAGVLEGAEKFGFWELAVPHPAERSSG